METALTELIQISQKVGRDKSLVLGSYGNTSVKTDDGQYMFIKASGTTLAGMSEAAGWRRLRVQAVLDLLGSRSLKTAELEARAKKIDAGLLCACDDAQPVTAMPSIESFFHALLDRVVIHLHPECVLSVACAENGPAVVRKIFAGEKYPPLWIPYVGLGYVSAQRIQLLAARYEKAYGRKPAIMFMENHGLLVSASTSAAAMRLVRKAVKVCQKMNGSFKPVKQTEVDPQVSRLLSLNIRAAVFNAAGRYVCVTPYVDSEITAFAKLKNAPALCGLGSVTPDEACQIGGAPLWLSKYDAKSIDAAIRRRTQRGLPVPSAFIVQGAGLFIAGDPNAADTTVEFARSSLRVRACASKMGGLKTIPHRLIAPYCEPKPQVVKPSAELSGRIAVVTGSGSGLGRSIAMGLARAGANVALADIDEAAARETAGIIAAECPQAGTLVLSCNVTSEDSVQSGYDAIIDHWGGLDICVNAAGVAPAYSLMDLPVDRWRFALEVNLTGYFLMARAAARLMTVQKIGGSIINISSKSGLDASKNNTAYNATKAGELHMARGWALELGPHNIRVNCVCPGNVFEGSKIWNPEYIKVCAKKYGIRPEEVIPFYVSKTALNREIKGQDIADSVVFLASDKARRITGQTIVPDAGQVFVR
jgi:NAD(P)-dependent dehydrogenase (short-subunit alcohol dehydrogenase family)/rhamnose utilization protein RhaD (predicted bifunctional aldolase and dehydrogenase)